VTEISVTPSAGNMFDVVLTAKQELPTAFQGPIVALLDRAEAKMREPYPEYEDEAPKKAAPKKRGKF
jgi:hypothetical protein